MRLQQYPSENHHGVFVAISGVGVLIIGAAGIGKSSLALELINHQHQLIADDVVEFSRDANGHIIGQCPPMLAGLLHSRELGIVCLPSVFGNSCVAPHAFLHHIIRLVATSNQPSSIAPALTPYTICTQDLPVLTLALTTPASLVTRIMTWLSMQESLLQVSAPATSGTKQ